MSATGRIVETFIFSQRELVRRPKSPADFFPGLGLVGLRATARPTAPWVDQWTAVASREKSNGLFGHRCTGQAKCDETHGNRRTGLVHTAGYGSLRDGAPTPLPQRQALHPSRIGVDIHINEPVAMRLSDAEDAIRAVLRTSGQRRSTSNDAQAEK